jgi:hypothetical protein
VNARVCERTRAASSAARQADATDAQGGGGVGGGHHWVVVPVWAQAQRIIGGTRRPSVMTCIAPLERAKMDGSKRDTLSCLSELCPERPSTARADWGESIVTRAQEVFSTLPSTFLSVERGVFCQLSAPRPPAHRQRRAAPGELS